MDMEVVNAKVNKSKIKVTKAQIIVEGTIDKPYFLIDYHEIGMPFGTIGFGSYDLRNVFRWRDECLELVKGCD